MEKYLVPSVSNNIAALVFGKRYAMEDPRRQYLDNRLSRSLEFLGTGFIATFLPHFLVVIIARIPFTREAAVKKILGDLDEFMMYAFHCLRLDLGVTVPRREQAHAMN